MLAAIIHDTVRRTAAKAEPWAKAHTGAWQSPRGHNEQTIRDFVVLLANYADWHEGTYKAPIGADGVLGPAWLQILAGARALLNGECGRLDCGTVDGMLSDLAHAAGFEPDELE